MVPNPGFRGYGRPAWAGPVIPVPAVLIITIGITMFNLIITIRVVKLTKSMHSHGGPHIGRVHMKVAPSYAERGHGPGREAHPGGHDSSRADRRSSTSFGRTTALARADRRAPTNAHSHAQDPECHDNHHYAENQRCKIPRRNDTLSIKPEEIESDVD